MHKNIDLETKSIPEKLQKRLHLTYFTVKCILIGFIFFTAFQSVAFLMVQDDIKFPSKNQHKSHGLNSEYLLVILYTIFVYMSTSTF